MSVFLRELGFYLFQLGEDLPAHKFVQLEQILTLTFLLMYVVPIKLAQVTWGHMKALLNFTRCFY